MTRLRQSLALVGAGRLWQERILPCGLPILLGALLAAAAAAFIVDGYLILLIPLITAIPVAILLLRSPWAAVIIWVLLLPYFVQEPFPTARYVFWALHRALVPAALAVVVLAGWFGLRKGEPVRLGRAEGAILAFLAAMLVNIVLTSAEPGRTLLRSYDRIVVPFFLYLLVRLIQPTEADWRWLALAGLVTVLGEAAVGIMGWFAPSRLPENWLGRAGERTVGTFGNPAVYTTTLIFLSLIFFQYAMQQPGRHVRAAALATLGLTSFCVFLSFSRGSWLGGALAIGGAILLYPGALLRWGAVVALLMAIATGTLFSGEFSYANQRLTDEETVEGRLLGASTAFRMVAARPAFGWGFGNYDVYDEQFKGRALDLAVRENQTSHNTFLLIAAELGLIGLLLYLFPTLWLLLMSLKVWWRMPAHGFLSWRLLWLLWLLILDHFVASNFMEMIHSNLFGTSIWWVAHGLIAALIAPYLSATDVGVPRWIARYDERRVVTP